MEKELNNQSPIIAIQGVAGAFHDVAATQYFGEGRKLLECITFRRVCEAVSDRDADFGIMAIENTIAGSLLQNYSLINEYRLKVIGESFLHIEMQLMGLEGVQLEDLEYIHSHPIAIAQCSDFLESIPKHIQVVSVEDTAGAAQKIQAEGLRNTAAIAGTQAAQMYGLNIIKNDIHTYKKNYTRFLILATESVPNPNANKASLCFEVAHREGALAEVLCLLAKYHINLTKIQSIPILGRPYQYWFYIDIEWNNPETYRKALHNILRTVTSLSILGEYENGNFQAVHQC